LDPERGPAAQQIARCGFAGRAGILCCAATENRKLKTENGIPIKKEKPRRSGASHTSLLWSEADQKIAADFNEFRIHKSVLLALQNSVMEAGPSPRKLKRAIRIDLVSCL
jgi:hypothetical protein